MIMISVYRILLDKEGIASKMQKPSYRGFVMHKPSAKDFSKTVMNSGLKYIMSQISFQERPMDGKIARLGRQGMVEKDD